MHRRCWRSLMMGRFNNADYNPPLLEPSAARGIFEYALHHLVEHEIDLSEI
jgi:hypothetical protein